MSFVISTRIVLLLLSLSLSFALWDTCKLFESAKKKRIVTEGKFRVVLHYWDEVCAVGCSLQHYQQVPLNSTQCKKWGWSLRGWSNVALCDITISWVWAVCFITDSVEGGAGKVFDSKPIHLKKKRKKKFVCPNGPIKRQWCDFFSFLGFLLSE